MKHQIEVLAENKKLLQMQQALVNSINHQERVDNLEFEMALRERSLERLERQEAIALDKHKNTLDYQRRAYDQLAPDLSEIDKNSSTIFQ